MGAAPDPAAIVSERIEEVIAPCSSLERPQITGARESVTGFAEVR
jgi:hypothetical protein